MVLARLSSFIEGHAAVRPQLAREVAALLSPELPAVMPHYRLGTAHLFRTLHGKLSLKKGMALLNGAPTQTAYMADVALVAPPPPPLIPETVPPAFARSPPTI